MSDEYQPNEVVESQPEPEGMASEPILEPEAAPAPDAVVASAAPVEAEAETAAVEDPVASATAPTVVSIAELEATKPAPGARVGSTFAKIGDVFRGQGWLAAVVVVVLLVLFLFLPPISLAQRIASGGGYTILNAENPAVNHPDGIAVRVAADAANKLRVKLGSIPRADFTAESLPKDLAPAAGALPQHLTPKSPFYTVAVRGKDTGPATIDVVIPNESEPWETLDLYTWDGETWRWIPARLDRDKETLVAEVSALPSSVMVMQSSMVQQKLAAEADQLPAAGESMVLTEADVPGMLIGTMGGLTGDATQLPLARQGDVMAVAPVVRNWVPGREPNWALVSDMLSMGSDRETHIANLLGLAQSGGYPGVVLDYRSVRFEDRAAYAGFVSELAKAFHEKGLWLAVAVDTPAQAADGSWDTGGYDWAALGAAADQLRVVMPLAPTAYVPGGAAEQLLEWAIARVDRYKLLPIYSTLGTDGERVVALDEILAPLGNVQATQMLTESVAPGTALNFKLGAAVTVEADAATGATRVKVGDKTQWLGTPQWLRSRLDLAARYHLGGVGLRDLQNEGNMPNLIPAIADYQAQVAVAAYAMPEIVWQVTGPDGKTTQLTTALTQPQFAWTAPMMTGTYSIAAQVAGLDKGELAIGVAEPAPAVTETLAAGEGESEAGTTTAGLASGEASDELKAGYVSDVTVADGTHFEKGEKFTKTWRLRNAGSKPWPKDTVLVFISGEQMSESKQVEVGEVKVGENVDISVDMVAPDADGSFKGEWALQTNGKRIDGGSVFLLIRVGAEVAAPVPAPAPGPVAPVAAGGFELGGHVRDMGLPYKDKMHYAGMNWVKAQVRYNEDAAWMVNVAHANGFKIQLSALGSPSMVLEPDFQSKYSAWVAGLARSGADAIEVWNEPNIDREWQVGYISPQSYTNLLCASYRAIKAANGGTAVISAAPAPTGWFGGCGPNGCDDQPWMEGMYAAGAANCMDYLGAHHNAGATSPSASSGHPADNGGGHHSWYFLPQTQLYYNVFHGTRQLFYTEMGYASQEGVSTFSDQFSWARGTNNAQQAAWLAEAVQLGSNTGMVRCIIVWNIDFVRAGYDPQDGYAIIRPGGSCPACDTLHNVLGTR